MGTVVDLGARRAGVTRDRRADEARARHPILRWVAGDVFYVAHRRGDQDAACGAAGELTLAPPGVPLCVECWPLGERDTDPEP